MSTVRQFSFSSGELAPSLYGRTDFTRYSSGLKKCSNFFVAKHGGAYNRPGTQYVSEVKDSSKRVKLIPFIFNSDQTYALEFGNLYIRVYKDGAQVTESATSKVITGITQANPAVVTTSTSHGYTSGQEVYISGVLGMTEVNGRNFKIANASGSTFELQYLDGTNVNSTGFSAYSSAGTSIRVFTLTTTYVERDLQDLQVAQSADVLIIAHHNYAPRQLSRLADDSWTISEITFAPSISAPTSVGGSGGTGSGSTSYQVTSVKSETFEESLPSSTYTIASTPTSGAPITVTWTDATGAQEYNVYKSLNGIFGFIGVASAGSPGFSDNAIPADTTDTPPIARNPFQLETAKTITGITQANPAVVTTSAAHGYASGDLVYIESVGGMTQVNNMFFFITVLSTTTFSLQSFSAGANVNSGSYGAYTSGGTVKRAMDYPSAVSFFQQRLVFANTNDDPEKVFCSKTGNFYNFSISFPIQDDDAVTFNLAGRQVNAVQHLIELGKLVSFTSGGEWVIEGDSAGILTPAEINPKQHSYNGAGVLPPLIIGGNALYVQARGSIVRDLGFDFQIDGYRGNDLTIFASHLFEGYTLTDWCYQQIPNSIVWCVRSDGTLLGMTYVKEQQVLGWHKHDLGGTVENVVAIPEGQEDALYVVVKRTIDGDTKRYIERLNTRQVLEIEDSIFMDSALTYDGRNTGSTTMTLTGSGWTYTDTLTLTASSSTFVSGDVGNEIHLYDDEEGVIRCEITAYSSATVVSVKPNRTVPVSMRAVAISDWARAVDELTNLWHLEGEDVSVFADGYVVASPNNDAYDVITVSDGTITLDRPYALIHVGLPFISDIETLDIDSLQGETMADKNKLIGRVTAFVESSRGIWAGPSEPTSILDGLTELKIRDFENYDDPVELQTGTVSINIQPNWNSNGRIFIRQVDPVPLSILSLAPAGFIPMRGGR